MPKVTIIVPIYNVEKYVRACFESLRLQSGNDHVVLAVNDGSPDNSQEIIDEYTEKYPDLFHSIVKENGGYGSVLQRAIAEIKTPYFLVCDPDDTLEDTAVKTLLDLSEVSGADITCGAKSYVYDGSDRKDYTPSYNDTFVKLKVNTVYHRDRDDFADLFFLDPSPHAKLYKTDVARNITFLTKVGYTDNMLFYLSLLDASKVVYTDISLANYLVDRPGNTMTDVSYKAISGQTSVFRSIIEQAEKRKNVPDIFWYRMFESFKYILYQTRRLNCTQEQYEQAMDQLGELVACLRPHADVIRPLYRKYTRNAFVEKQRDAFLLTERFGERTFGRLKKKMAAEFAAAHQ